jgi:hypothetical protein
MLTRLEKLLFRLEAQHACLSWVFGEIAGKPGIIFELGLGHGRTFHHLRHHLPEREIFVFERQVDSYPDCTPDADHIILGDIGETLPKAAQRFKGQVVLAHSDVGTFESSHNRAMARMVSELLPPALCPGAFVLSDLQLTLNGARALELPAGAKPGRYHLYQYG